jgi:hypothetical protein
MLLQWGFAKKSGAWISFDKDLISEIKKSINLELPEKIQGMDQLRSFLESNTEICNYLNSTFKEALAK